MQHDVALDFFLVFSAGIEEPDGAVEPAEGPSIALADPVAFAFQRFAAERPGVFAAVVLRLSVPHPVLPCIRIDRHERHAADQRQDELWYQLSHLPLPSI